MAHTTIGLLREGRLDDFGVLLHESWQEKKRLAKGISNSRIDEVYTLARQQGAIGGKITGAGGGGFLLLYCHADGQEAVTTAMEQAGLARMDFHFDRGGAVVLMDSVPRIRRLGSPERALAGVAAC
jgi:D-glycero-alpha-D-manno-heptose-7-phosphate kinase